MSFLKYRRSVRWLEYVLLWCAYDSWYSSPKMFWNLRRLNLDGIGMLKKSQKTYLSIVAVNIALKLFMNGLSILELKSRMIIYSAVWYKHNMKVINLN